MRAEYAEVRERTATAAPPRDWCRSSKARAQRFEPDWAGYTPPMPSAPGINVFDDYPLAELFR